MDMKGGRQIVGKRAVLLAAGIFLLAQAGLFFLGGENPFAEFGILVLFAWGGLSTALGAVLAIAALSGRAWREGDDLKSVNGPGPLLPPPDYGFNLPTVCSLLQEGLVLLRQEKIVYANQSFAYLLGVQEDELTGTS
ncbi:hypothetical protein LJC36_02675, partial [Desulfovibrio sp. OttesenSCG-928-C14]|nr:hypothetical protein [Desulfovibrio sp. OttesenSCG-928-C14]